MFRIPQLPGAVGRPSLPSPRAPIIVVIVAALAVLGGLAYVGPGLTRPWQTASVATPAAVIPVVAPAPPVLRNVLADVGDIRQHLERTRQEIVGATEDLARAERTWTAVATQLDRNYLETQRRRADAGTTTARAARARLERALDELQVATERLH